MDPIITSSLISAGSNLLGNLFGGGSSNKAASRLAVEAEQRSMMNNYQLAENLPAYQVAGWKKAGIHPLAGLGLSTPSAPAVAAIGGDDAGSKWGRALSDVGQGVSRAVAAYASREEREMAKMSAGLQLENQQLQNDRLRSEIALMHQAGTPPGMAMSGNVTGDQDARYPTRSHLPLGLSSAAPRYIPLVNPDGSITNVTSPEAGDNELLMTWDFFLKTLPDEAKNFFRRTVRRLKSDFKPTGRTPMRGRDY